jgi:Bacterial protein of unknown function (DUF885)
MLPKFLLGATAVCLFAAPSWVVESDRSAKVLLKVRAQFEPEAMAKLGLEGLDEQITDLKPRVLERYRTALQGALAELEPRLAREKDPLVRQDLEILVRRTRQEIRGIGLAETRRVPYYKLAQTTFMGIQALLDDQIAAERRQSALVRLRKYTGLEEGYTPVAVLAEQRIRERLGVPGLLAPSRAEIERDLANTGPFLDGIAKLFEQYKIAGYQDAHRRLKEELAGYDAFLRKEVLPRSRNDFRLPPDLYAFAAEEVGVEMPPAELAGTAHTAFTEIQKQMQEIAATVAKARGLSSADYRDVIRELKKEQLAGSDILPHYQDRLKALEQIIRRERLLTLPERAARIELASPAETAAQPAPHMSPPRLLGNQGEQGKFILPLNNPTTTGETIKLDDFTFAAASWTLTAHEARPGHELQFATMVERGVSVARAIFAFNSANVEGWGLYSEAIVFPYIPPEGQLISLQHRLMRAARAFLDPELHAGKINRTEAYRVLREDVVLSQAMATQEVERYMFRAPAQATSYFYGYIKMLALRSELERTLGA